MILVLVFGESLIFMVFNINLSLCFKAMVVWRVLWLNCKLKM
jgi:hypothetical protein